VIRRFTGQSVVVAEVLGEPPETPLQPGDVVVSR
jgi:hypothetical protein